jgi:hypothetical protein
LPHLQIPKPNYAVVVILERDGTGASDIFMEIVNDFRESAPALYDFVNDLAAT